MAKETHIRFWDANGVAWIYNSILERVYVEGTLEEDPNSGYGAFSLEDAIEILTEYGYMEK